MSARPWTDEEIGFLDSHKDWSARRQAEELGRTVHAVKNVRRKIARGWTGPVSPAWTEEEDETLRESSPTTTAADLMQLLPGRELDAIRKRRQRLGLLATSGGERPTEVGPRPLVAKTCRECGLLLAGSWFLFIKRSLGGGHWNPDCRRCSSKKGVERNRDMRDQRNQLQRNQRARLQSLTLPHASRSGEPYTEEDFEVLSDVSLTDFEKAVRLKRTYAAVQAARTKAGLTSKPDGLGDPERDRWVIHNPNLATLEGASA